MQISSYPRSLDDHRVPVTPHQADKPSFSSRRAPCLLQLQKSAEIRLRRKSMRRQLSHDFETFYHSHLESHRRVPGAPPGVQSCPSQSAHQRRFCLGSQSLRLAGEASSLYFDGATPEAANATIVSSPGVAHLNGIVGTASEGSRVQYRSSFCRRTQTL